MSGVVDIPFKYKIILLVIALAFAIFISTKNSILIKSLKDAKSIEQVYVYSFSRNHKYLIDEKTLLNTEDKEALVDIIKNLQMGANKEKKIYECNALLEYKMLDGESIKLTLYFDTDSDIIIVEANPGGLFGGFYAYITDEEGAYRQELIKLFQE